MVKNKMMANTASITGSKWDTLKVMLAIEYEPVHTSN